MLLDFSGLEYQSQTMDTHDGAIKFVKDYTKLNKLLAAKEQEKLNQRKELRAQLENLFHPEQEPVKSPKQPSEQIQKPIVLESELSQLTAELNIIRQEILANQEMMRLQALAAKQAKDEEDIKVILMLMSPRISNPNQFIQY